MARRDGYDALEYNERKEMILEALEMAFSIHDEAGTFDVFASDSKTRLAASKCLEIVGEALHVGQRSGEPHASKTTTEELYMLRNRLAHVYNKATAKELWDNLVVVRQSQLRDEVENFHEPPEQPPDNRPKQPAPPHWGDTDRLG